MRLTFRGWRREVSPHHHEVKPAVKFINRKRETKKWRIELDGSEIKFSGKISKVHLSGDFFVEIALRTEQIRELYLHHLLSDPIANLSEVSSLHAALLQKALSPEEEDE